MLLLLTRFFKRCLKIYCINITKFVLPGIWIVSPMLQRFKWDFDLGNMHCTLWKIGRLPGKWKIGGLSRHRQDRHHFRIVKEIDLTAGSTSELGPNDKDCDQLKQKLAGSAARALWIRLRAKGSAECLPTRSKDPGMLISQNCQKQTPTIFVERVPTLQTL